MSGFIPGLDLGSLFYHEAVKPVLAEEWPEIPHSAGLIGSGSEILGYDTRNNMLQSVWMDNMGTSISSSSKGSIDKAAKTLTVYTDFFDPQTGKPKTYKMVTKIVDDNNVNFAMIGKMDGKDHTEMEIAYTRVK